MRLKPHDNKDDAYKVWMSRRELNRLIETMGDRGGTQHRIAGRLGGDAGLRRDESSKTRPVDVVESHGDMFIRVWEDAAKMDKYRETPIPTDLGYQIEATTEAHRRDPDDPILDVCPRTLNRWTKRAAEQLAAETGDEGWMHVTYHDLRRSWGTGLLEEGTLPSVVMDWGGWDDWETFREHYLGEFSPEALRRERRKVSWLSQGIPPEERPDATATVHPAVRATRDPVSSDASKPYGDGSR